MYLIRFFLSYIIAYVFLYKIRAIKNILRSTLYEITKIIVNQVLHR
jgi:hypothetical protein